MIEFRPAFDTIFREAFFGIAPGQDGTWFVERHEGFFDAIDGLSHTDASRAPGPGVSSIAAHTDHARYYIEVSNAFMRGESPKLDWESSWKNQAVDASQWDDIRSGLRGEVETLLAAVSHQEPRSQEEATGLFAGVAHAAFHLGAVRQLLKLR